VVPPGVATLGPVNGLSPSALSFLLLIFIISRAGNMKKGEQVAAVAKQQLPPAWWQ
jgi:hypothetical protein